MQITFAISKFGFGHLTRQFALCEEINKIQKGITFQFVISDHQEKVFNHQFTKLNAKTFTNFISPTFVLSNPDEVDRESTIYSYQMAIDFDTQIRDDTSWGQVLEDTDILVNDIEFFHNPIAKKMEIPIINISNFTWSDLLEPVAKPLLTGKIRQFEQMSDLNIKLPFASACESFDNNFEDYGLLTRSINYEKSNLIKKQFKRDVPIIFISSISTGFGPNEPLFEQLVENYNLILTSNVNNQDIQVSNDNLLALPIDIYDMQNYIDAADLVIGKTGYGIVSEC
ncbi:MAG: hypothetical protein ACC656_09735, partial [Candidatus Heimdallarchaeota archaeon]